MKKLLSALAAVAAAAALLLAMGSLRWRPGRRPEAPRLEVAARGAGPLAAGAAEAPLRLPERVPVAGYPRLTWSEAGSRDPLAARALVLSEPGCSVALVSLELLLVPGKLAREIESRVRDLGLDALVVGATHTHAGPGGFWKDAIAEHAATGPYDRRVAEAVAEAAADAVHRAAAARGPALLEVDRGAAPELVRNRNGGEVDGSLLALRLSRPSGPPLAQVVVYGAHATLLGMENRRISGDWPGELMRAEPVATLFFQGAVGDQTPRSAGGAAAPRGYALAVSAELRRLERAPADPAPALAAAAASALLPPPDLGASPTWLRRFAANLIYEWVPARGRVTAVRLGPALLVAVPAEPVAAVARRWRERAGEGAEVISLAGDYLGYVETSARMADHAGETVRTYYGPELGERLGGAVAAAASAVDGSRGLRAR